MKRGKSTGIGLKYLLFIVATLTISCKPNASPPDQLLASGSDTLTIITLYSSTTYFIYKGEPMGYEYEIAKSFADSSGMVLKVRIADNAARLTEMLQAGEGDLIAYQLPMTTQMKQEVLFCGKEQVSPLVLVQRANRGDTLLRNITGLLGKEVYVKHNTRQYERMVNLDHELGGGIQIKDIEKDTVSTDDLIEMVSNGIIPYTVADRTIAQLNRTYYQNINYELNVSFPQRSSWAVRKEDKHLAKAIDEWAQKYQENESYKSIHKRYFERGKHPELESFYGNELSGKGKISPFDSLFRHYGAEVNIDWRLLASVAFQESGFSPTAVAWTGAEGLMGIMPKTAEYLGLEPEERRTAEGSIRTGAIYLNRMRRIFSTIESEEQQMKFALGAYNAGIGHILDARALTEAYGKDKNRWDYNVEEYVRLKSLPEYYNDSIVKHGYLRGSETYNYVRNIFDRWDRYREAAK